MSPRAGGSTGAGWRAAIVVVLVTVLGASGCAVSAENAAPAGGAAATGARSSDAPAPPAVSSQGSAPVPSVPSVPSLTTDDLDELLPGTSDDAYLRPRWEVRDELWELGLLRGLCGADLASPSKLGSGAGSPEHDAEQWWQGTSPQYATLDVLRWPGDAPGGAEAWRDEVVADESGCREALVLPDQLAAEGGPDVTVVVRRWEQPATGGTPGNELLPQWQVGGFAVDGSTAITVRVGAYSARTAQEAWTLARPGLSSVVGRAAQRVSAPPPPSSS